MNKNKIMSGLVCLFALLLASFALADASDITGPTEDIVIDVSYSGLDDDSEETLTYTKTLTFENTDTACPTDCDAECETCCTDCGTCVAENCDAVCTDGEEPSEDCLACMNTECSDECTDCIGCMSDCDSCEDESETVSFATSEIDEYTVELSGDDLEEDETLVLLPGESKEVTLTVTVPINEDSGSHEDVGSLTWTVDGEDNVVDINTEVKSMLTIDSLKFYVDGSKEDTIDESGEKTSDVAPGSEVEFRFQIENLFNDEDYDEGEIEDVVLTMEFANSDDEDDFEEEIEEEEEFDLEADTEETIIFDFKVPAKAEEDSYELVVKLEGKDGNGAEHTVEWTVLLDIDREKDDVRIENAYLTTNTVICSGETYFKVKVANYGSNDQDDVALNIASSALGINVNAMDIELDEDPDDDDNSYSKTVPIVVDEDLEAGTYTIDVRVYIDGDEEVDHRLVQLTVLGCAGEEVVEEEEESESDVLVQTFEGEDTAETTTAITGGATTVIETVETTQSKGMTAFMVVVVVLLVVLIALMLGILLKK